MFVCVFVFIEEYLKPTERQDTVLSSHTVGSSKEVTGSTCTLQVRDTLSYHAVFCSLQYFHQYADTVSDPLLRSIHQDGSI